MPSHHTIRGMNGADFCRQVVNSIPFYTCRALDRLGWVRQGFSLRNSQDGPMSLGPMTGDSREKVAINRRLFLNAVGLPAMPLATLSQIHSDRVQVFEENDIDWASQREGDAITTRRCNLAIAVQIADCFPVLAVDMVHRAIAAIHSGWRGTAARVLRRTLDEMSRSFGTDPTSLLIAIGPGIRSCCMQVGEEVARQFDEAYPGRHDRLAAAIPRGEISCRPPSRPGDSVSGGRSACGPGVRSRGLHLLPPATNSSLTGRRAGLPGE